MSTMAAAVAVAFNLDVEDVEHWPERTVGIFYRVASRRGLLMPEVAA